MKKSEKTKKLSLADVRYAWSRKQVSLNPNLMILPLILVAFFVAAASAIWSDYRNQIMKNQKQQLLLTAKTLAENMELTMYEYQKNLDFLTDVVQVSEQDGEVACRRYLDTGAGFEDNIFIEDADGSCIWSVKQHNLQNPVFFSQIDENKTVWLYETAEGYHNLIFKKHLNTGNVLCLSMDAEQYYKKLISTIHIGTNGYVVVKSSSGLVLMHPEREQWGIHVIEGRKELYPDVDLSSLEEMIREQCSGGDGVSEYYSYWWSNPELPRVKKISAYAPAALGQDFWVVSAVVDYDDFYLPIEHGFRDVSLLYMGVIAAILLLSVLTVKLLADRKKASIEIDTLQELNKRLEEVHRGEEMLAHQQRLQVMGTMTGGIAHEFNNFLTPIMGHAELLMMELPEDSEEYDSALEIYEASEKARDVIRQLSSMSRRNVETVYKEISISKLMSRAVKMISSICPSNIQIITDFDKREECILGNSTQLNQVLLNICVNAFHAIKKQEGKVEIQTSYLTGEQLKEISGLAAYPASDSWKLFCQIRIRDNGCGMESHVLRQIFEPFFTTKKTGEGTGLGLALAEQIVVSHKGYIYAESEPGTGSTFYVILPVMETGTDNQIITEQAKEPLRLIIADDNAKVLEMLQKNFQKLHVPVSTCRTRNELSELLKQEHPDALILDESLEDTDGIAFFMSIQGIYPDILKIIMTDCFTKEIVEAKFNGIIDGYLLKPVSDTTILETILSCRHH
ncbi:MAG: ATP-binding protein [Brotaphodocola sp.]